MCNKTISTNAIIFIPRPSTNKGVIQFILILQMKYFYQYNIGLRFLKYRALHEAQTSNDTMKIPSRRLTVNCPFNYPPANFNHNWILIRCLPVCQFKKSLYSSHISSMPSHSITFRLERMSFNSPCFGVDLCITPIFCPNGPSPGPPLPTERRCSILLVEDRACPLSH